MNETRRTEIRIIFDNPSEIEYVLPLNLLDREIVRIEVDGIVFAPRLSDSGESDCEIYNL